MRQRDPFHWPADKEKALRRARRLEYATIFFLATIVVAMYFTLGGSQAMRTAWYEDLLGFVPSLAFLGARHFEKRPPDERFPFGYFKAVSIAYLVAATALMLLALYMIYDSGMALLHQEHPTLGLMHLFGYDFWIGWAMIAALLYSIVPPVVLGRMKAPVAKELHDPVLMADAAMQQADWMTAAAAIAGIIGVGFGLWWADSVAAILIALDVLNDGRKHIVRAVADLADHAPTKLTSSSADPVIDGVREAVMSMKEVEQAQVQLRTEGHLLTGTIFVRCTADTLTADLATRIRTAAEKADWRVYDPAVTLLPIEG